MRSEIEWAYEWIDLPSLTTFILRRENFTCIGSVILESSHLVVDWTRYPSIIIWWNPFWYGLLGRPFPVHLFPPILKYVFSHLIIIRCSCSRISYQKQNQVPLGFISCFIHSLITLHVAAHETLNNRFTNPVAIDWEYSLNSSSQSGTSLTVPNHPPWNPHHFM